MNFFHTFLSLTLMLGFAQSDPSPLQDYCVADRKASYYLNGAPCINPKLVTSAYFSTSALAKAGNTRANPFGFNSTFTTLGKLPGMNTLGLALSRIDMEPNGIVPPHSHPRASEVTICLMGSVLVGFVDTSNALYTQRLRVGEAFVFPRGLIHFLYNTDPMNPAFAVSGFNSQNPGAQIASLAAFTSNPFIPDEFW